MVFGMFMAILDIQIVSASLTEIQAGLAASRRDLLGADRLSDRRSRRDPAVGLPVARARHADPVRGLRRGLHRREPDVRATTSINEMIVWRAVQGFIGGGMIPTVFASAFMIFPRRACGIIRR